MVGAVDTPDYGLSAAAPPQRLAVVASAFVHGDAGASVACAFPAGGLAGDTAVLVASVARNAVGLLAVPAGWTAISTHQAADAPTYSNLLVARIPWAPGLAPVVVTPNNIGYSILMLIIRGATVSVPYEVQYGPGIATVQLEGPVVDQLPALVLYVVSDEKAILQQQPLGFGTTQLVLNGQTPTGAGWGGLNAGYLVTNVFGAGPLVTMTYNGGTTANCVCTVAFSA
jgi:hypothetical protein